MKNVIDIYTTAGAVSGKMDLPESLFNVEVSPTLIAMAVRVLNANGRQGTSKVKSRGEVNLTTHKVYKQKGTGRARHGAKSAPIFVGGGVAHGPSGEQSYDLHITKKMNNLAIRGSLTSAFKDGNIIVVDGLDKVGTTTKELQAVLENLKITSKAVLMLESPLANVLRAGKNIKDLSIVQAKRTNVVEILGAKKLIMHKAAIDTLLATFSPKEAAL